MAGDIDAGKTSLIERLGARLGWQAVLEPLDDNPDLPDFYVARRAWPSHMRAFYLSYREHSFGPKSAPQSAILSRKFYETLCFLLALWCTWTITASVVTRHTSGSLS